MEYNQNIRPMSSPEIDFDKLKHILRSHWMVIVLIFILANATAYAFIRYTKNLYQSSSELKLEVKNEASELGIETMMMEDKNRNLVSGEVEIIQSELFLNRVLDFSAFDVNFFSVGRVLNDELFLNPPATVVYFNKNHSLYNQPIAFEEVDERQYKLQLRDEKEVVGRYAEKVKIHDLELVLKRNNNFKKGDEIGYFLMINSRTALLDYLRKNLTAEPLNYSANTIHVSFKDYDPYKAQAVLNKIDSLYLQFSNEQKNLANKQKIDWLTNELGQIEKKMEAHENYFENFTLQNKTSNLDEDLKETIIGINKLDSQRYHYTRRLADLDLFVNRLNNGEFQLPIMLRQQLPPIINTQLDALQQLQLEQDKLKLSYQEITFAYRQKAKEIEVLKAKSISELTGLRDEWHKRLQEVNQHKAAMEKQFASLPDKNTEFSKNQRFYKLYEEFYLSLMQSKSQFEIAMAGSIPDFRILAPASLSLKPISPNNIMVAGAGFVASMVFIFFFIGVSYLANNKITGINELEKNTTAPLLGAVPMMKQKDEGLHVRDYPRSMVSEAIRTLRTNLDFFNIAAKKKVIAVSSTVSGEGKSFIAMNLGGAMALSKKKVILIDLDMRKAKTNLAANESDPSKGVSTVLIRKDLWQECVVRMPLTNFDYLPSGPHPPNPSELLMNTEFTTLLTELKEHYDCIVMDTPPVGLVTDGIVAMKSADVSVYVFRANYSKKDFLSNLQRIISINKFSNITTLLNAVPSSGKTYGYGYYEENGTPGKRKSIFRR